MEWLFCPEALGGAKARCDEQLLQTVKENNCELITPRKTKKDTTLVMNKLDQAQSDLYNRALAKIRQPIVSYFNLINQLTHIQAALKVRSEKD